MDNPFYADTFMNPCGYEYESFLSFLETHFFIKDPNSKSTQTEKLTEDKATQTEKQSMLWGYFS